MKKILIILTFLGAGTRVYADAQSDAWGLGVIGNDITITFTTKDGTLTALQGNEVTVKAGGGADWTFLMPDGFGGTIGILTIDMEADSLSVNFAGIGGNPAASYVFGTNSSLTFTDSDGDVLPFNGFTFSGPGANGTSIDLGATNFSYGGEVLTINLSGESFSKSPGVFTANFVAPEPGTFVLVGILGITAFFLRRIRKF